MLDTFHRRPARGLLCPHDQPGTFGDGVRQLECLLGHAIIASAAFRGSSFCLPCRQQERQVGHEPLQRHLAPGVLQRLCQRQPGRVSPWPASCPGARHHWPGGHAPVSICMR